MRRTNFPIKMSIKINQKQIVFPSLTLAMKLIMKCRQIATDAVYCDDAVTCEGSKCAHVLVGTKTFFTDVYGIKSDKKKS